MALDSEKTAKIRWGILATGGIAKIMARALQAVPEAQILAVGSRTKESAQKFADEFKIPKAYGSYEALAQDSEVDVIYIASPHTFHAEHMRLCLRAGKHVLCEKPFTINAREAAECLALAKKYKRILVEAMWVRWLPEFVQMRKWISEGKIGRPLFVKANLCFRLNDDPQGRIYNPELGGGALLDVGVYPVSFASMIFGSPTAIKSSVTKAESTGVDISSTLIFDYEGGRRADISCSVAYPAPQEFVVSGNEGYISLSDNWGKRTLILNKDGVAKEKFQAAFAEIDYRFQALEIHRLIREDLLESAVLTLDESLAIMETMDALRKSWGLRYPSERGFGQNFFRK